MDLSLNCNFILKVEHVTVTRNFFTFDAFNCVDVTLVISVVCILDDSILTFSKDFVCKNELFVGFSRVARVSRKLQNFGACHLYNLLFNFVKFIRQVTGRGFGVLGVT